MNNKSMFKSDYKCKAECLIKMERDRGVMPRVNGSANVFSRQYVSTRHSRFSSVAILNDYSLSDEVFSSFYIVDIMFANQAAKQKKKKENYLTKFPVKPSTKYNKIIQIKW